MNALDDLAELFCFHNYYISWVRERGEGLRCNAGLNSHALEGGWVMYEGLSM